MEHDLKLVGLVVKTEFDGLAVVTNAWADGRIVVKLEDGSYKYDFIEYCVIVEKSTQVARMVAFAKAHFASAHFDDVYSVAKYVVNALRSHDQKACKHGTTLALESKVRKLLIK